MTVFFFFIFVFSLCLFCLPRQSWWKFSACHSVRDAMRNRTKLPWNLYYFKSNWYDFRNSQRAYLSFLCSSRNSKLFITSEWIWIWRKPTVHLPYFIHRVRQNCQTNHFTFPDERFLFSFFKFLNLKNRWCDEVTWLLSTNFMKDRQGECVGKVLHPYRVWKAHKQWLLENT